MLQYNLTVGLVPIRRDVSPRPGIFNWEKAEQRGRRIVRYIEDTYTDDQTRFLDLDDLTDRFNGELIAHGRSLLSKTIAAGACWTRAGAGFHSNS